MVNPKLVEILDQFRHGFEKQNIYINSIVLFGSQARGDAREDSDIDLVVISRDFAAMGYWDRIEALVEAQRGLREPIEAVAKTPEEWEDSQSLIVAFAKQDGKIVYQAA